MSKGNTAELDELVDRGLQAVEDDELDTAESILDDVRGLAGENHARVLHLAGMLAWGRGELERATGFLMQAADAASGRADVLLDCAECLFAGEELEEAEVQVRAALALPELSREQADDGRLLLSQIRLGSDDPEEALEILDEIDPALRDHPAYLSTRGSAQMSAGNLDQAIADFRAALAHDDGDSDLHYQMGLAQQAAGDREGAVESLVKVLELDRAEDGETEEPTFAEVQELRARLEEVLEQLPDPLLKLVASSPITVQARATLEQVRKGLDPRSAVCFQGTPKSDDDEAELTGLVIMRDLLPLDAVEDEEALESELFYAVMDEMVTFFKRDDLILAEA